MLRNGRAQALLLLLLSVLFAGGIARLFLLRFQRGDVYPAYSSLRTDPLGTKALYDSLSALPELEVRRNYRATTLDRGGAGGVMFYLGLPSSAVDSFDRETVERLEALADGGGRVVVSFAPEEEPDKPKASGKAKKRAADAAKEEGTSKRGAKKKQPLEVEKDEWPPKPFTDMTRRWGFGLKPTAFGKGSKRGLAMQASPASGSQLPGEVRWLTSLVLVDLGEAWRVVYRRDDQPVLVERPWGKGSLVLSTDSYFLSNEALMRSRYPRLLAWLVGPGQHVVFDETHFGIAERPGVASLARKYRLQGLLAGLLLLAFLYGWKNSAAFLPLRDSGSDLPSGNEALWVEGKDAAGGLVNLLRRSVDSKEVLEVCFEEWKKSLPGVFQGSREKLRRMEDVVLGHRRRAPKERNPVEDYQSMVRIWTEGKG